MNPIYFLNSYLFSSKFISCMKPPLSQKQPAHPPHCEQTGGSLELLETILPTGGEKEANRERAGLRDGEKRFLTTSLESQD